MLEFTLNSHSYFACSLAYICDTFFLTFRMGFEGAAGESIVCGIIVYGAEGDGEISV